jgi:alpha-beta hydrolase superfamily lysophospholipase
VVTPTERFVDVNGVRLRIDEAGPADGPLVILAHGFPELAFSWRRQIPALAAAGYRVLAPDQRPEASGQEAGTHRVGHAAVRHGTGL